MLSDGATRILAISVLVLLAVGLVSWILNVYRKSSYTLAQFPLYMLNLFLTRVLWRATVRGRLLLPKDQGAVIVCNHVGPIDPGFIALACDRPVHWMVAREYCLHPAVAWAFRILEAIPVGRAGIDTAATKLAMRYARQGHLVGMFPEGRVNNTNQLLLPGRPGAAMVALKARVPVVPCYITGSPNDGTPFGFLLLPARTWLTVGRPIDISEFYGHEGERGVLEELTRRLMIEIAKLAGVEDYEPKLAGRRWKPGMEQEEPTAGNAS
ncbi:MAG: lysophospholipid acyltransferase family protein [Pirellulales bacterium]